MKCDAETEAELQEYNLPKIANTKGLKTFIDDLIKREHTYGTCCYAMSLAAYAAFTYTASQLGVTGFQASCADLDFIKRTRGYKGPFILLKGEDLLYPQYNLQNNLEAAIQDWGPWIKEQATELLAKSPDAHPKVIAHWKELAQ